MLCSRWNFQPLQGFDIMQFTFQLHRKNTIENKEKLPGNGVKVSLFISAGRHFLMNNQHVLTVYQIPTIAIVAPEIMLCIFL
ncbi:hypothetical protein HA41_02160 [Pantoea conspicua]|uniref:Uncharacterized protein n=1 Tax=Pantoea conspicua TaxID=472705 RepID=A0A1X1C1Q3_9GAMM|nr:hypothetical protein HA41_02160 [Pantoea conspicua]